MEKLTYSQQLTALLVTDRYNDFISEGGKVWGRLKTAAEANRCVPHTCLEATVRYAAGLGYDVTVVKDATADYSNEEMHAALDVNLPNYPSAIVTTHEVVASISTLADTAAPVEHGDSRANKATSIEIHQEVRS